MGTKWYERSTKSIRCGTICIRDAYEMVRNGTKWAELKHLSTFTKWYDIIRNVRFSHVYRIRSYVFRSKTYQIVPNRNNIRNGGKFEFREIPTFEIVPVGAGAAPHVRFQTIFRMHIAPQRSISYLERMETYENILKHT